MAKPVGPYSPSIRAQGFLFCSGQVGLDPTSGKLVEGGTLPQLRQALSNLDAILKAEGLGPGHVVKTTLFLIETSGEMVRDRNTLQPSDRLERAKREVLKRIESLPQDVFFGVVSFGGTASRWHEGMTLAAPQAKADAHAWVTKLAGCGWPDLGVGLQAAWGMGTGTDETPADTVVLVAAGTPVDHGRPVEFSGILHDPDTLTDWLAMQGRYRNVILHAVGVGSSADKQLLKDLVAATGGTYRNID